MGRVRLFQFKKPGPKKQHKKKRKYKKNSWKIVLQSVLGDNENQPMTPEELLNGARGKKYKKSSKCGNPVIIVKTTLRNHSSIFKRNKDGTFTLMKKPALENTHEESTVSTVMESEEDGNVMKNVEVVTRLHEHPQHHHEHSHHRHVLNRDDDLMSQSHHHQMIQREEELSQLQRNVMPELQMSVGMHVDESVVRHLNISDAIDHGVSVSMDDDSEVKFDDKYDDHGIKFDHRGIIVNEDDDGDNDSESNVRMNVGDNDHMYMQGMMTGTYNLYRM